MKLYYYIDTGHRRGLDRLRRSAPVIKALQEADVDVTMLTNDFRAGEYAKEQFGIRRYVSVDVVRNIANIATPADALVFDSDDAAPSLLDDIIGYFGRLVRISDDPEAVQHSGELLITPGGGTGSGVTADIVDTKYFAGGEHTSGTLYFWGDDDYEQKLLTCADAFAGMEVALLEGYYFFMQYADELQKRFSSVLESEAYDEALQSATRFITSSAQSALEALAAGSRPVYVKRESAPSFLSRKMERFGIPVAQKFEKSAIEKAMAENPGYKTDRLNPEEASDVSKSIAEFLKR
ncbi:hypothetical protein [Hydrogenimonas sp.]